MTKDNSDDLLLKNLKEYFKNHNGYLKTLFIMTKYDLRFILREIGHRDWSVMPKDQMVRRLVEIGYPLTLFPDPSKYTPNMPIEVLGSLCTYEFSDEDIDTSFTK